MPWRSIEAIEIATAQWVDWFNIRRIMASIGDAPPVEHESAHCEQLESLALAA